MIPDKYLPIGTIVMLKGGKKRVMICGFLSINQDTPEKVYDYSGCLYPEGVISTNQTLLFDHSQIEMVYHMGLIDDEEKNFKQKLVQIANLARLRNNSDVKKSLSDNPTIDDKVQRVDQPIDIMPDES